MAAKSIRQQTVGNREEVCAGHDQAHVLVRTLHSIARLGDVARSRIQARVPAGAECHSWRAMQSAIASSRPLRPKKLA